MVSTGKMNAFPHKYRSDGPHGKLVPLKQQWVWQDANCGSIVAIFLLSTINESQFRHHELKFQVDCDYPNLMVVMTFGAT